MLDRAKFAKIVAANGGELPSLAGGATEKVILRESKKVVAGAGGELFTKQFFFVTINSTDTLEMAVSGSVPYPLMDTPKEGEFGTIALLGIAKITCGGTIAAGERVACNNKGEAVAWAAGQFVAGITLEKGESEQIISIIVPGPAKA